jgi:hypothetical protein
MGRYNQLKPAILKWRASNREKFNSYKLGWQHAKLDKKEAVDYDAWAHRLRLISVKVFR